jgi:ParB-like chromosome segregation protein Spo0J
MKIQQWAVDKVFPYRRNPRDNEDAVEKVAASIKEFGFRQPIVVDKDSVIIVGHTRLLAPLRLGMKEVPVLVAADLSPAQVKTYRLADNRVHEEAEWDEELPALELGDLSRLGFGLEKTGFDVDEINALCSSSRAVCSPAPKRTRCRRCRRNQSRARAISSRSASTHSSEATPPIRRTT